MRGEGRAAVKITAADTKVDDGAQIKTLGADGAHGGSRVTRPGLSKPSRGSAGKYQNCRSTRQCTKARGCHVLQCSTCSRPNTIELTYE